MSHFTRIRTQMVEKEYITQALQDLGYSCEVGQVEIRGYGGQRTSVEIRMSTSSPGYHIGFRKSGETYELVADWWGIEEIQKDAFVQQLTQRYAYHATRAKLEEQRFSLVTEDVDQEGRLHLVLRRMV